MHYLFIFCSLFFNLLVIAQEQPSLIPFRKQDKWGYCDTTKNILIPVTFKRAFPFVKEKALVETAGYKLCLIDTKGKTIKELPYKGGRYISETGLLEIYNSNFRYGLLDLDGSIVLAAKYGEIQVLGQDSFKVIASGKQGIINSKGDTLSKFLPCDPDFMFMTQLSSLPGSNCKEVCQYKPIQEHMAVAALGNKFGYMDSTLKLVIPCKYIMAESFLYGLGRITIDNERDQQPTKYENGIAVYNASDLEVQEGYVDNKGREYWEN